MDYTNFYIPGYTDVFSLGIFSNRRLPKEWRKGNDGEKK